MVGSPLEHATATAWLRRSGTVNTSGMPAGGSDALEKVTFMWDSTFCRCHAIAENARQQILGEFTIDVPQAIHDAILDARGRAARLEVEDLAAKYLQAILALRGAPRRDAGTSNN
jgi:hypothetical protein